MFANKTLLHVSIWCPFCKEDTVTHVNDKSFEIKGISITTYAFTVWVTHKKCQEDFQINLDVNSISTEIEGKVIDIK